MKDHITGGKSTGAGQLNREWEEDRDETGTREESEREGKGKNLFTVEWTHTSGGKLQFSAKGGSI